jgi:hypothetical protein
VLLDIGGDVGALVVEMPGAMVGVEVEIRPDPSGGVPGAPPGGHLPHVAVVNRRVPAGVVPSLVFPDLTEGRYQLCLKGSDDVELSVEVTGGVVTEAAWPGLS